MDTDIRVYYDGSSDARDADALYGQYEVWSDYGVVWHGGSATDASGNTTITANGGITLGGETTPIGKASLFDGSNDYLLVGNTSNLNQAGDVYVSSWVKRTTNTNGRVIVGAYQPTSPYPGWGLSALNSTSHYLRFYDSGGWRVSTTAVTTSMNFSGAIVSGTTYNLYIDGNNVLTGTGTAPLEYTGDKAIGATPNGAAEWYGNIGETRIRREMTSVDDNCCLLYTSPSPRDGLLSRMPSSA